MKKFLRIFLAFLLIVSLFPMFPVVPTIAAMEPIVNVKLVNYLGNKTEISIIPNGNYQIENTNIVLENKTQYKLKIEGSKIKVYKNNSVLGQFESIKITPLSPNNSLSINNRAYLGSFNFVKETIKEKTHIRPINSINIENYLRGVVPAEMPALWPKEAVKAQAVAARTYAMKNIGKTINDTISYQVYGGINSHHPNSDAAVKETEGLVLKYNGMLIDAVFSASNGGKTESNANAWNSAPVPYLTIKDDPFDTNITWNILLNKQQIDLSEKNLKNPDEWWNLTVEKDSTITSNIKTWLSNNKDLKKENIKIISVPKLSLTDPGSGGRVTKGSIIINYVEKNTRNKNNELLIQELKLENVPAATIRALVGNSVMKSYLVTNIEETSNTIFVAGRGYGHGVGLSQYGAKARAEAGHSFREILSFYYPGTNLVKEYDARVERLSGKDRYETNISILKELPDKSMDNMIVVTGQDYPDAITGGALSNSLNAAIVLVKNDNQVIQNAKNEINRLLKNKQTGTVYFIGGTGVISKSIEQSFKNSGFNVKRLSGADRTETAIEVAKKVNSSPTEVFLTYGYDFPDALSIAPAAAKHRTPILLNKGKNTLSKNVLDYLKSHGVKKVTIIGGTGVISNNIVKELETNQIKVSRISGKNRILTALEVAKIYYPNSTKASLANGYNFPDALSGGSFAFHQDMPVLLTHANSITLEVKNYLNGKEKVYLFGGKGVISVAIETNL